MRYYRPIPLDPKTRRLMAARQSKIDSLLTHADRVKVAASSFKNKSGRLFGTIRKWLHAEAPEKCMYCEYDRVRDIEHIWPKAYYPERCFAIENYIFACSECN